MRLDGSQVTIRMKRQVKWDDSIKATFGDSDDLQIYHGGSHSYIEDIGTGQLRLKSNSQIQFLSDTNDYHARMIKDEGVELYYDNTKRFETTNTGGTLTGNLIVSNDLNVTGDITARKISAQEIVTNVVSQSISFATGSTIFGDASTDEHQFTGSLNVTGSTNLTGDLFLGDNRKVVLGDSTDFLLHHNGTDSVIDNNTGRLELSSTGDIILKPGDKKGIICTEDAQVELYYNDFKS